MATLMSIPSHDGRRIEYVVTSDARGDVEETIRAIRQRNPQCAVSFRGPYLSGGRFRADGWLDQYQGSL